MTRIEIRGLGQVANKQRELCISKDLERELAKHGTKKNSGMENCGEMARVIEEEFRVTYLSKEQF